MHRKAWLVFGVNLKREKYQVAARLLLEVDSGVNPAREPLSYKSQAFIETRVERYFWGRDLALDTRMVDCWSRNVMSDCSVRLKFIRMYVHWLK